ncbi:MAG: ADOP family duplicated permease [Gemmatimonadaceae bacterium]
MSDSPLRRLFRLAVRRRPVERDIDDEIAFHLDATIRELTASGLSVDAARAEASRRFGDVDRVRTTLGALDRKGQEQVVRRERWRDFLQDLRQSARSLSREPRFVTAVVLTLALGIGANATMFGVVDRLLLRPPPHVRDDPRLSLVYFRRDLPERGLITYTSSSYPFFDAMRADHVAFDDVAAYWGIEMSLGRGTEARKTLVTMATPNFFQLLGTPLERGRGFSATEWEDGGEKIAVVTHDFAVQQLGGVDAAIGRALPFKKGSYVVVGVTPAGFNGTEMRKTEVFVPMAAAALEVLPPNWRTHQNMRWLEMVGRVAAGQTQAAINSRETLLFRNLSRGWKRLDDTTVTVLLGSIVPQRRPGGTAEASILSWLSGVSLIVLLIACANVSNLMLARAQRRRREFAVRITLGAGRARLTRQLLTEALMLAGAGGVLALVIAKWGSDLLNLTLLSDFSMPAWSADARVLLFTALAAGTAAVVAGLVPALLASRPDLTESLKSGAREGGGRGARARQTLIVAQAALSTVLLIGAGLFVHSLQHATRLEMGYDASQLIVVSLDLEGAVHGDSGFVSFWNQAQERVAAIPGVVSVSQSVTSPFQSQFSADLFVGDRDSISTLKGGSLMMNMVTPEYFRTMGTKVLAGRGFTSDEGKGTPAVTVINRTIGDQLWPGESPLGKCFRVEHRTAPCATVVGIVEPTRVNDVKRNDAPQFYLLLGQDAREDPGMRSLFVRVAGKPSSTVPAIRRAVQGMSPSLAYADVTPVEDNVAPELRPWRIGASMFGIFGLAALVVAAFGLYSVIAYDVDRRRHELGVRVALGATRRRVVGVVLATGLRPGVIGVAIGLIVAALGAGRLRGLLFETSPREASVFVGVALLLLTTSIGASLWPARQAASLDPADVLRSD